MKSKQIISNSKINKLFYKYYDSELNRVKSEYVFDKSSEIVSADNFYGRRNSITNFIFVSSMVLFIGFCSLFYDIHSSLEEAITDYYKYNNLDKRIPEVIEHVKDYLNIYKR